MKEKVCGTSRQKEEEETSEIIICDLSLNTRKKKRISNLYAK